MKKIYKDIETAKKIYLETEKSKLEKLELSKITDFNKLFEDASKQIQVAEGKGLQNLRKVVLDVESDFLKLSRFVSEALALAEEIEESAKDLGIDLGNEIQGKVNVLKSADARAEYWIKELNADQYR